MLISQSKQRRAGMANERKRSAAYIVYNIDEIWGECHRESAYNIKYITEQMFARYLRGDERFV